MNVVRMNETLDHWRVGTWRWRVELSWPAKLGLALMMAAVTGLAAQIRVPLPFTPVPATGQVFAVLLAGALLGGAWGGMSQVCYVGLGAVGLPWFSGWAGGLPLGPTAGYLLGFIPAAILVGCVSDRYPWTRHFAAQVLVMALAVVIIYLFGAICFSLQTGAGFVATLSLAVFPFIGIDLAKAVAAAGVAGTLLPKQDIDTHSRDRH